MNQWQSLFESHSRPVTWLYSAAIAAAELLIVTGNFIPGVLAHAVLLVVLLTHYLVVSLLHKRATAARQQTAQVVPALALVPFLRLLSLTTPTEPLPVWGWFLLANILVLGCTLLLTRALGYHWAEIGLRQGEWKNQVLVALTGPPLALIVYLLAQWTNAVQGPARLDLLVIILLSVTLFIVGSVETVVLRGLIQLTTGSLLLPTILFGVLLLGTRSPILIVSLMLCSYFLGWCIQQTGRIWGAIVASGIISAGVVVLLPVLLSQF